MSLVTMIAASAVAWPVALGLALADRADGNMSPAAAVTYLAAARVCHQRPDRSFRLGGAQWPVCARCAGLYLAAPLGVALAWVTRRPGRRSLVRGLAAAAVPTAVTWALEVSGMLAVGGPIRFAAAVPLGAAIAHALVHLARRDARID